jgi:hypothetical protein
MRQGELHAVEANNMRSDLPRFTRAGPSDRCAGARVQASACMQQHQRPKSISHLERIGLHDMCIHTAAVDEVVDPQRAGVRRGHPVHAIDEPAEGSPMFCCSGTLPMPRGLESR